MGYKQQGINDRKIYIWGTICNTRRIYDGDSEKGVERGIEYMMQTLAWIYIVSVGCQL
jgi:hypothetical protein